MRETSIDETPQIINVLKGEIVLVHVLAYQCTWHFCEDEIDKMKVKPGITGYTQAYYRNGLSNREKRVMDAWYANNVNLA